MRLLSISKSKPSVIVKNRNSVGADSEKLTLIDADQSTVAYTPQAPLPPPNLKIKKVDHYFSKWFKKWKYVDSGSNVIPELRPMPGADGKDDPWQQYCFVVVRELTDELVTFKIVVKSQYLLKACKEVIAEVPGVSWNASPIQLDPKLFITFLPDFKAYRDKLEAKERPTEEEKHISATVNVLIGYFRTDYRATMSTLDNLTSHGEISYDLLYAILVPRSTMLTRNSLTGEIQAFQLTTAKHIQCNSADFYELLLEGIDVDDTDPADIRGFTRIQNRVLVAPFEGVVKINSLDAYPIKFSSKEAELRQTLLTRGRKWEALATGVHHMFYEGTGGIHCDKKLIKYNLDSRVMIDRGSFRKLNANYAFPMRKPMPAPSDDPTALDRPGPRSSATNQAPHANVPLHMTTQKKPEVPKLTEDELIIVSPILYGFSLSDKIWLEFDVDKVETIRWNDEAFSNLVLPEDRKVLLQSLVEAHNTQVGFDDFIQGKGRGLVVNLFGPPGVGKTLSAEATSEHVRRPLYVVGAGDLGTTAAELDVRLQRIFELATTWKAIILIDEADVFLEERSLHDLERNAMVAVFLRHLEYYPAILFLTTNRVKTFDEAFLSRIHIALHFHSLSVEARKSVWTAFLAKTGVIVGRKDAISEEELNMLATRDINGRQVKNAVKTANSLAVRRGETLSYAHLKEVLNVMDQFATEFQALKKKGST